MPVLYPIFVALVFVFLPVSSAGKLEKKLIIGGASAKERQFPWMVALFIDNVFKCTSSILGLRTVLTAAHCVEKDGLKLPAASFHGIANYRKTANEVRIDFESLTPHPSYNDSDKYGTHHDIAILTTSEPIAFCDKVQPICIARSDTPTGKYKKATSMGWGLTKPGDQESEADVLKNANLTIISNAVCSKIFHGPPLGEDKLCAGKYEGICMGDSGGPLVHFRTHKPPIQLGVASYVHGEAGCGSYAPGVFTRVSFYNDFIVQNSADGEDICRM